MSALKPGDLCVITETALPERFRGMQCVIIADLEWIEDICDPITFVADPGLYYEIRLHGESGNRYAKPSELRRIDPKSEYDGNQAGDWSLCPFQPKKIEERT